MVNIHIMAIKKLREIATVNVIKVENKNRPKTKDGYDYASKVTVNNHTLNWLIAEIQANPKDYFCEPEPTMEWEINCDWRVGMVFITKPKVAEKYLSVQIYDERDVLLKVTRKQRLFLIAQLTEVYNNVKW